MLADRSALIDESVVQDSGADVDASDESVDAATADTASPAWVAQNSGTMAVLDSVWGSGTNDVYISGGTPPVILHSKNGGMSWVMLSTGGAQLPKSITGASAADVYFGDDQNAAAALHTKNGGMNWTSESVAPLTGVFSVVARGDDVYCSGLNNMGALVHASISQGKWSPVAYPSTRYIYGMALFDSGVLFACGPGGLVLQTGNAGQNWTLQNSPTGEELLGIWGGDPMEPFSVGNHGAIIHTVDGGKTWVKQNSGTNAALYAVWGSSAADVYAVGENAQGQPGIILHSIDHGTTWLEEPSLAAGNISYHSVWGSSASDVSVVGDLGTIVHKP